jgi:hypothetical protein
MLAAGAPETPGGGPPRPGLREQVGNTKRAATGLIHAHIELAKAEVGEILGLVKTISILAGVILVIALFTGNLVYVGTWLAVGESFFGSLAWGVVHGLLFGVGLSVMLVLVILGVGVGRGLTALLVGAVVAVVIGLLFGSRVIPNAADTLVAGQTLTPLGIVLDPGVMLVVGIGAALLGLLGLIFGARAGGVGGAIGGLIGGAILGVIVGWIVGSRYEWQFAWGLGVAVGLIVWAVMQAVFARGVIDIGKRFAALKPTESIEAATETKEWLGQQWANRRSKLVKR